MESLDPTKRVTRSQLPLPDSHLSLTRSPLKDARMAQRSYHIGPPEPVPEDTDTDDEILLSPGKTRQLNSRVNSKRSASPPPQDEYSDPTAAEDGRELKRLKRDADEMERRSKRDAQAGGSDVENMDINLRATAAPTHSRNLSEPVVGSSHKSSKPRSTSKQTTASPKGKGRAQSVPVFPILDLSNPPTTPWRRRARSRSPSKERDSPKLQITFTSLPPIPDESAMPSPSEPDPTASREPPTIVPPTIRETPSTPTVPSALNRVFATPMSPLTPLPETPRRYQARLDPGDPYTRTIGWGADILVSPVSAKIDSSTSTSAAPKDAFKVMMASKSRGTTAKSKAKGKEKEKILKPSASSFMPPSKASAMPSASTSAVAGSSKAPPKPLVAKEKGKAKAKEKEKVEVKSKEEKKVSLKAKMRPREKPKPLPLPMHVRLPEESDGERTSTPTTISRPETPTTFLDTSAAGAAPAVPAQRFSSPLTDMDDEAADVGPPLDDDGPLPPASSSPDILSPVGGTRLALPEPSTEPLLHASSAVEESAEEVDMPMKADRAAELPACADPPTDTELKTRPKSRARVPASLPAPADRVTRSASLKRKEAEGGVPTQKKLFSFGVGPATTVTGNPAKKQKMNDGASSHSGLPRSPTKIPVASPSKLTSFANPTKASTARSSVTKPPVKTKPVSAAAAAGDSSSPTKNKLVRATSLFTARPPRSSLPASFTRTFTGPGGNPSSLQTLASALEKLRMPPPERPNTSMGFSRDDTDNALAESTRSADERGLGIGRPTGGLQRAATVASIASTSSSTSFVSDESSKLSTAAVPPLKTAPVQRPLSAFMGSKNTTGSSKLAVGTGSIMRGGLSLFGGAGRGRAAPKVSRNPGLPSVMGSPVKGGGGDGDGDATMREEDLTGEGDATDANNVADEGVSSPRGVTFDLSILESEPSKKGKEKERLPEEWRQHAARRASMAGLDLSKSVTLPSKPLGLMGPPEERSGMRSTSSSYPSSFSDSSSAEGMRRSTRIAKSTPAADTSMDDDTDAASETQRPAATPIQPLTILKGCIVFVDIISDIGDDSARSFITEMLKNLGARVLGSVGQTCTHIVYKNGLRSTYNRYKALSEPKPLVVGMEWVVQSAEKRNHEDETPYLIDMDDMNTTATKRRKSMLPRLMSGGLDDSVDGDYSFDGSSSSMIMDDDLTPLERARLRKAGTIGI
ncbi:hypothetical protein B0H15DRAFT_790117 [Mycena belliarum]|uniref:BRCT domain-containing protein n=1 Tax=Mycena belliarum TaxID=1033014 RepID=A0AAD6TUH2_9AGAR|nr:hypothetical protein B0H15DRAFT_790117 [Mycena belliae]